MIKFKSEDLNVTQRWILNSYKKTLCDHQKDSIAHRKNYVMAMAYQLLNEPDDFENMKGFIILCELLHEILNDSLAEGK